MGEKFTAVEIATVSQSLLTGEMDPWQAAEFLQIFFTGHGYGLSHDAALQAATVMESSGCNEEIVRREMNRLALVV